jgi:DNA gyrase subunit A
MLFFTNRGRVFRLKCYEIPSASSRTAKGLAAINLIPIAEEERITDMVAVTDFNTESFLILATRKGEIKKTASSQFAVVRSSGLIAMDVELGRGDELVSARLALEGDDVMMITRKGQSIRFAVSGLRASLRTSGGVSGMRLSSGDEVITMEIAHLDDLLLVVTANGYGKLTPVNDYPKQKRAGSGVRTFKVTDKTGEVTAAKLTNLKEQVMIISADGIVIRTPTKEKDPTKGITIQGRSTQGVRLMRLAEGDMVSAITTFEED